MPNPTLEKERVLGEAFQSFQETTARNAERRIRESNEVFRLATRNLLLLNGGAAIAVLAHIATVSTMTQGGWAFWAIGYLSVASVLVVAAMAAKTSSLHHQMLEFAQANSNRIRGYIQASGSDPERFTFEDGDTGIHRKRKEMRSHIATALIALSASLSLATFVIAFLGFTGV